MCCLAIIHDAFPLYIHCKKKVFNLHGEENQQITENII